LVEWLRFLREKKPRFAIYENVKNIVGARFRPTFDLFVKELEDYGYNVHWQVLNAKNYGIPQNRERVYCVIIRKDLDNGRFKFPEPISLKHTLADMLETDVDEKYYLSDEKVAAMITPPPQRISKTIRVGGRNSADRQHQWDLVAENARSSIE
jgi:DNA (cytosine-5)-methyltransferase 1